MIRSALRAVAVVGAVAGAALAAEAQRPPSSAQMVAAQVPSLEALHALKIHPELRLTIRDRSAGMVPRPLLVLWPRWSQGPTAGSGAEFGSKCGITGWIYDWGVENVSAKASQHTEMTITCELVGGGEWPAGQRQFLQDRLCGCMTRTFYVPSVPPHTTDGFGVPNGLRFRSFQGLDPAPCNDPQYPHARVTVKVTGQGSATVELCQ